MSNEEQDKPVVINGKTFKQYMQLVDKHISRICSLGSSDIDDYSYYDNFLSGVPASECAEDALTNAGFDPDML